MQLSSGRFTTMAAVIMAAAAVLPGCSTTGGFGSAGGTLGGPGYDQQEQRIINQARTVGAVVGAGAGYAIARNNSSNDLSRLGGAALGGLVGGLAGDAIGKTQADKARAKRLDNEQVRSLVAATRANNERLVAYNRKVANRIAQIRKAEAAERSALAKAELPAVDRAIKQTDQLIQQREADRSMLAGSERSQLERENRTAKSERAELVSHRNELATLAAR